MARPRHSRRSRPESSPDDSARRAVRRLPWPRAGLGLTGLAAVVALGGASAAVDAAPGRPAPTAHPARAHALPRLPLTPAMLAGSAPGGVERRPARPVHVARPAPATKPVIAGLAANGIPAVALNAYRLAAARLASADPGCGIGWPLLAAIGRVESDHGRFGGATLAVSGDSAPRIIGIALDGSRSAFIGDTDSGRLDGDARYDHAVGPMQFIPGTWAVWAVDGNGDGIADPFNVDDAALAAARYLCASGGNLRTSAGQVAAVLAYNNSDRYLAQVLALARAYDLGVPVGTLPISGPTAGALPPVEPGTGRPVNPADPPAGVSRAPRRTAEPASAHGSAQASSPHAPPAAGPASTPSRQHASSKPPSPHPSPMPTASPTPSPTPTRSRAPSSSPPPNPVQSVVNGVLCSVNVLGIRLCPSD